MKKSSWMVAAALPLVVVGSIAIWELSGDDRKIGAITAASEPVSLTWRGTWSADGKYQPGQVVAYEGSSYVAAEASLGEAPKASSPYWALLARQGERGPAGDAGPQGQPGPAGERGPSDAYVRSNNGSSVDATAETMASLPLGPGKYVILAKMSVGMISSGAWTVECWLRMGDTNGTFGLNILDSEILTIQSPARPNMNLTDVREFTQAVTLNLLCRSQTANITADVSRVRLAALKVETLTTS